MSLGADHADERTRELADNLGRVHDRVRRACAAVGRDPAGLTVIVVTKFFPEADIRRLAGLGVRDLGENRDQEASTKYRTIRADLPPIRLHFIGQVQTNKAKSVATYADVVHTLDRPKLVTALDRAAQAAERRLRVLLQVDLDPDRDRGEDRPPRSGPASGRGGIEPRLIEDLVARVKASTQLDLGGVMAVAPLGGDPDRAFGRLAEVAARVRATASDATWISAGMSGDLEAAIRHGATHLRVGTAILGSRPPLR